MHNPDSVQVLFSKLLAFPSLSRYAGLPALFLSSDFTARGGSSSVTRFFVRFGGPRFGAPNLMGPSAIAGPQSSVALKLLPECQPYCLCHACA